MKIRPSNIAAIGMLGLFLLVQPGIASAATIKVLCSNGIRAAMEELTPQFERLTKHKVEITFGVSALLERQIEAGESFDLAVLTPPLIELLVKRGKIAPDSGTVLARTGEGIAVRAGAPRPEIGTTEALKRTLLNSKSITFAKEGASGLYFADLVQRLGLADALKSKFKITANGAEAGALVARGEAELGVLPVSEILAVPGVEVLGTFPAEIQDYVVMEAGVASGSAQNAAAKQFIQFLTAPAAAPVLKKKGMEAGR
jgi:molybdate transport system substrate-binding protein